MQLASALSEWRVSSDPKTAAMRAQRERLPAHKLSASVVETCARAQVRGEGGLVSGGSSGKGGVQVRGRVQVKGEERLK